MERLRDRDDAGARLARLLAPFLGSGERAVALGLPRGGVAVAAAVARALSLPLDVLVVRKLGAPGDPEFGFGAIGEDGVTVLDRAAMDLLGVSGAQVTTVARAEQAELDRRLATYRSVAPALPLRGRTALVIDDGIATGGTMRAAVRVARARGASRVIAAAGVAAPDSLAALMGPGEADHAVAALIPDHLRAVGTWYADFSQTPDEEVVRLLGDSRNT